jgi:hypothetical protein
MDDSQAWKAYPQRRKWFNKLWLSDNLGYDCGPCGVAPEKGDYYIVRPIYNLSGMGAGARRQWIDANDCEQVEPGFFWCEFFEGKQFSVTYDYVEGHWAPKSSWLAVRNIHNLSKFHIWTKNDYAPELPCFFDELSDVKRINVEFIENKPIEVHLRDSPDPDYDIIIPIWKGDEKVIDKYLKNGYTYIKSFDDADGFIQTPRLGFIVK